MNGTFPVNGLMSDIAACQKRAASFIRSPGVTWIDGELWHDTWENDRSDVRRIDPRSGEVREKPEMPPGVPVSGLESGGGDQFFCGGGSSGKVRAVRRPKRWSP